MEAENDLIAATAASLLRLTEEGRLRRRSHEMALRPREDCRRANATAWEDRNPSNKLEIERLVIFDADGTICKACQLETLRGGSAGKKVDGGPKHTVGDLVGAGVAHYTMIPWYKGSIDRTRGMMGSHLRTTTSANDYEG